MKKYLQCFGRIQSLISNFLLGCCCTASGQQLNFDYYNKSNGLVNNEVHCIIQATSGLMYFGTPSGLSIYDGASFTNYDLSKGFRNNFISDIKELRNNEFALFTRSSQFYQFSNHRLQIDSCGNIAIKNIYHGKSGNWYACTYPELYLFNNHQLLRLPVSEGTKFQGINCVMEWEDSLLVVGRSYEQLDIYDRRTWKLVASSSEKLFVRNFFGDHDGNIWIATIGSGIMVLKPGSVHARHIQFEKLDRAFNPFLKTEFRAVMQDKENNLWMGSINNGLIKYNNSTHEFMHITTEEGLAGNSVFSLCCDKEDNIWIGTNRGLQKLVHKTVLSYSSKQGIPADLIIDALPLPGNRILTCGYSGVGYIKGFGEKIKAWEPPLQDEYFLKFASLHHKYFGLSLKKLIALTISPDDVSVEKEFPLPDHFRCMTRFHDDKLILGGDHQLLFFSNGKMQMLTKDSIHMVSCIQVGVSDILWTGSLFNSIDGYQLTEKNKKLSASLLYHYPVRTRGAQDYIQCIAAAKSGRIIYGTSQSGIFILTLINNKLKQRASINTLSGLSNNNALCLTWYNDTTLLVGTGYGLDKIIFPSGKDSFYVRNINDYYNFSSTVYSIQIDERGNILLGTEAGLIQIPSINIEQKITKNLPIIISSVTLLSTPDSMINVQEKLVLSYNNNGIDILYSSPSFTNEKNIRYTYVLTGGRKSIQSQPSFSNHVTFPDLSPGNYRFTVSPVNMYGEISASSASVNIVIRPAFWQSWWFNGLLILAAGGLAYVIVRRRINNIKRESVLKNKIAETEMMALRAQMNPHFIFNCMNIIDGLITSNREEEARDFLQKFSKLIRLVLENSQYQEVPIQQDLQALKLYIELEAIRSNHHFTYSIDVDEGLSEENYKIPPLLLQPYIENAIVHGLRNKENREGILNVKINREDNTIKVTIEDNGIGRKKAMQLNAENMKPHQPLGMKVTANRIDLLRKINKNKVSLEISDLYPGEETGTRVTITLSADLKFE